MGVTLLSIGTNQKTIKSDRQGDYLTAIMYLSPAREHGLKANLCPKSSEGCVKACLYTSGRGNMNVVQEARISRARLYIKYPDLFKEMLRDELSKFQDRCKGGVKPAVRLNGTSDIVWEKKFPEIFKDFPDIQFYDYTKIWNRRPEENNYHLTYSYSEDITDNLVRRRLKKGSNVAIVFSDKLPDTHLGYLVEDGTKDDLRFRDTPGTVVGLKALGRAKKDTSGFVIRGYG